MLLVRMKGRTLFFLILAFLSACYIKYMNNHKIKISKFQSPALLFSTVPLICGKI